MVFRLFTRPAPVVSEASLPDAAAIASLHQASFRHGWSKDEVERLLADRTVLAHRAVHNGMTVGFVLSRFAADEAEILSLAVAPSQRGKGIAGVLLDLHMRRLAGLKVRALFLEVEENNAPALRLYRRAGFRIVGRRPNYYRQARDAPADALVMRRDLV